MTAVSEREAAPAEPAVAASPAAASRTGWSDLVHGWRNRLLASPAFHRFATRFPLTRPIARRQSRRLFDLCAGFAYSQVLSACVQLRLFDHLSAGPLAFHDLASRMALPLESADRLLVAATSLGLVEKRAGGRFGLGLLGAAMLGNPGVAAMVLHHSAVYPDLADPVALLRRGGGGGRLSGYWPYAGAGAVGSTAEVEPYTLLMSGSQPLIAEQVLDAYPLSRHRCLLDVGGGDGAFLATAARRYPQLRGTLFDLPPVAAMAADRFARERLAGRCEAHGGDLRSDRLPQGCDVASLIRVVHDHDDAQALAILRQVRAALPSGGTLLIAEPMAETRGAAAVGAYFAFYLLAMGSGKPRSQAELTALLRLAGFTAIRPGRTANPLLVRVLSAKAAS